MPLGPLSITVDGATVSTVHVRLAGVASALPTGSIALTWNVCGPSVRLEYVAGEAQAANVTPSSEHWKVAVASGEVNENVADVDETLALFAGPARDRWCRARSCRPSSCARPASASGAGRVRRPHEQRVRAVGERRST